MLYEDHFEKSAFIDLVKRKLHRYAIPHDVDDHNLATKSSIASSSSSTEHKDLAVPNVDTAEVSQPSTSEALSSIEHKVLKVHNVDTAEVLQPSTSAPSSSIEPRDPKVHDVNTAAVQQPSTSRRKKYSMKKESN